MTDQEINRAIAEALTVQGFDEGLAGKTQYRCNSGHIMDRRSKHQECLYMHRISFDVRAACLLPTVEVFVPHDFTDPHYLLPALEAWRKQDRATRKWRIESAETGIESPDGITPERKDYGPVALIGDHLYMCDDPDRDPIAWAAEAFAAALGVGE